MSESSLAPQVVRQFTEKGLTLGTAENPVGTVWLGVSTAKETVARRFHFDGDRQSVRRQTVETALRLALDVLHSK